MPSAGQRERGQARSLRAVPDPAGATDMDTRAAVRDGNGGAADLVSLRAGAHNLPRALSSFVGRRHELEQVGRMVVASPLVTITGPTGMGKTRLAVEIASRLAPTPADGVWLVQLDLLGPDADAEEVGEALASVLDVLPQPGQSFTEALVDRLKRSTLLVVLDNCEHVAVAVAAVAHRLLGACPWLSVLATSQRPLAVPGEQVWPLTPLSLPAPRQAGAGSDAVALFHARARALNPGFMVTDEGAAAVAETCRRLDGIPLAIELAAARTAVLSPTEIAELLDERFGLLTTGGHTAVARHQTLQAALDWSYGLLSAPEQALLRRLSVFAGGAGLDAVRAVCIGGEVGRDAMVDLLGSLVTKSLVVADITGARARYRLLETVRAYGRDRLAEAASDADVAEQHAAWFADVAEHGWHQIVSDGLPDTTVALEADHANLRAALAWLVADGDTEAALGMGSDLAPFWKARGHFREGRLRLEQALALGGEVPPAQRVRALWGVGLLSLMEGSLGRATASLDDSLTLARRHGYERPAAEARHLLAFISVFTEDPLTALPLLEESVAVARARGDDVSVANALILYGRAHLFAGDTAAARGVFEECRELGRSFGEGGECEGLVGLGWVALSRGEHGLAAEVLAQALPMVRQGGEQFETALVLSFLGELAWRRGETEEARALLDEGVGLARAISAPFPLARCLLALARVALTAGDPAWAHELVDEAAQASRRAHFAHVLVECLHARADLARAAGHLAEALAVLEEALALATDKGDRMGEARSRRGLAALARLHGDYLGSTSLSLEALDLHVATGDAGGVADTLEGLAGLAVAQERAAHAARLLGAAHGVRHANGSVRSPWDGPDHDVDTALVRGSLSVDEFEQAFGQGAALALDEAVALAARSRGARKKRPTSGWASLTPTERQVADLVADGLANREIAERMFLSPRTVQGHLLRVFPKVGVASRRELREAVRMRQ